jgi:hypothetical protein
MRPLGRFWPGVLAGIGIGLLLGSSLVELGWLTASQNAWANGLGTILCGFGVGLSRCTGARKSAEVGARESRA